MYNYVNKINVGANQDKTEVLLSFIQETPQFNAPHVDEDGNVTLQANIQSNNVADIVVTGEFAKEIARLIISIVGE